MYGNDVVVSTKMEQEIVEGILAGGKRISIKQANLLREESEQCELNKTAIKRVFEPGFFPTKVKSVKFSGQFLSEFLMRSRARRRSKVW